jgi:hypothetical protein
MILSPVSFTKETTYLHAAGNGIMVIGGNLFGREVEAAEDVLPTEDTGKSIYDDEVLYGLLPQSDQPCPECVLLELPSTLPLFLSIRTIVCRSHPTRIA